MECVPCDKKGKEYSEKDDMWVDSPKQLEGSPLNFIVKLNSGRGLPNRYTVCIFYNI